MKAFSRRLLLHVADGGPERGQNALLGELQGAFDIRVSGADQGRHHFAVGGHRLPAKGDFGVLSGGGGGGGRVHDS